MKFWKILVLIGLLGCVESPREATEPLEPVKIKIPGNCQVTEARWAMKYDSLRRAFARYAVRHPAAAKRDTFGK